MRKAILILSCLVLQTAILLGQCPDRGALWKRLELIRSTANIPPADQLKEMLPISENMKKCHFQNDSTYVFLLQRIGVAYHVLADEINAYKYTRASVTVIAANTGTGRIKPDQLMRSYYNLSLIYASLQLIPEQNMVLDSFINLALKINPYARQLYNALLDRARYCFYAGDYEHCISYSTIPDLLVTPADTFIVAEKERILTYRLNALIALKDYDSAAALLTARMGTILQEKNTNILGTLYGIAANIARDKGDYPLALTDFRREFGSFLKINYKIGCAESLNAIGYLYFEKLHDPRNALRYYRQALTYDTSTEAISTFDNIALLFTDKQQYDSAFFYFQQAFNLIGPGMNETTLLQGSIIQTIKNMVEYVITLMLDKGDMLEEEYRRKNDGKALRQAILVYKNADRLLNRLKSEQTDFTSRLFWRTNSHRLYEHAIAAAWQENNPDDIFYFLEKSRAVLLNDQLNQQRWAASDDILKEAQLKTTILTLQKELDSKTPDSTAGVKIQSGLFEAKQALARQEQTIKQRDPLYYQHFLDTGSITLQDLRTYLQENRASILLLYTGDSAIYIMLVTPAGNYLNKIDKPRYDSTASAYMSYLSDPSRLNRDMRGYIRTAHYLYQLIFPRQTPPAGRIIISPDGNYFPFEALAVNDSLASPGWFLYDHPTSYTYSASYLLYSAHNESPAENANPAETNSPTPNENPAGDKDFMGVAPVHYAAWQHLPALQGSDNSLDRIGSYFHSADQFTAGRASRHAFLQNFSRYRLIQLYTHAIGNGAGKEPIIYFADSSLSLSQLIPDNKPAARLIVLSACESGNGQFYQGEGIFSFNREFAALGIPASVINLWSVDNEATYALTEHFYKYLSTGDPADIALQKAKLEFLRHASDEQRLPYYWAAPLLTGRPAIITQSHSPRGWLILLPLALLLLVLVLIFNQQFRRR